MLKLKYLSKKLIILVLCGVLLCSMQACAACTGIYVGQDVSEDGSIICARTNDYPEVYGNHITVTPGVEDEPGRTMPIDDDRNTSVEIPATTYKYTATPYMDSTIAYSGTGPDAATALMNMAWL